MNDLHEKEIMLIKFLIRQDDWATSANIAQNLNLSDRTIRNYIKHINAQYNDLILSSHLGYKIDKNNLNKYNTKFSLEQTIPQTTQSRVQYIFKHVLFSKEKVNIYDLCEELFISDSTFYKVLSTAKKQLIPYDLIFRIENNYISIEGNQSNKRKMISDLIMHETENFSINNDIISHYFPDIDIKRLKEIVLNALDMYGCYIDDYFMTIVLIHLVVIIGTKNPQNSHNNYANAQIIDSIYKLVEKINDDISKEFNYRMSNAEEKNIAVLLSSRVLLKGKKVNATMLDSNTSSTINKLITRIINELRKNFSIDLDEIDFKEKFVFHLNNLFFRLVNGITIPNPQLQNIKYAFPFTYEISIYIAEVIYEETGYRINEDEIGFIALHIGIIVDEKYSLLNKITCGIILPYTFINYEKAIHKITETFKDSLIIRNIFNSYDEITNFEPCEMYVSLLQIPDAAKNVVFIQPFVNNDDVARIHTMIVKIKKEKVKQQFENKLKYFFSSDLFYINDGNLHDYKDVIEFLGDKLIKMEYVNPSYKEDLYTREQICPSSLLNVAIPHTFKSNAKKSAVSVVLSNTPIKWINQDVNIIFMISIAENQRMEFRDLFNLISEIICMSENVNELMKCSSYEEFINKIMLFISNKL